MVEIDGEKYLDGGLADSIPVEYFESIGYDRNVAVLTRPLGYRKKPNDMMPLIRAKYKKYPELVKTIAERHIMYNRELDLIAEKEAAGRLFVIRPEDDIPVRRVEKDPEKLHQAYDLGRKAAEEKLLALISYLS